MKLSEYRFGSMSLSIPKNWIDNSMINFLGPPADKFRPNAVFVERVTGGKTSLKTYGDEQKKNIENSGCPEFNLIESGLVDFAEGKQYHLAFSYRLVLKEIEDNSPPLIRQDLYIQLKGNKVALLTLSCHLDEAEKWADIFQDMASNTHFYE